MNEIDLRIIICLFNKWNFTEGCLNDLRKRPDNHEIIIIDNNSSDETSNELMQIERSLSFKNLAIITNKENLFHSKACNQGFEKSIGKNILFINNDIRIKSNHETWTRTIIDTCSSGELVGPTM